MSKGGVAVFSEYKQADAAAMWQNSPTSPLLIFVHTPLCGTCQVARKMIEVVDAMHRNMQRDGKNAPVIYECNANLFPNQMQTWRVKSVPALLVVVDNRVWRRLYAFESVSHVDAFIASAHLVQDTVLPPS